MKTKTRRYYQVNLPEKYRSRVKRLMRLNGITVVGDTMGRLIDDELLRQKEAKK